MYKFGMVEDDSTYIYTEDVSESAKPSTPVTKGTLQMSNMSTPVMMLLQFNSPYVMSNKCTPAQPLDKCGASTGCR